MNGVVEIVILGSMIAAGLWSRGAYCEEDFFGQAEPSQHVMHIRKLSDSDKLRIELEPVWFHVESAEPNRPSSEQLQGKRQVRDDTKRPCRMFPNIEQLARYERKQEDVSQSDLRKSDASEAFLKHFWQMDDPSERESHEEAQESTSLEGQLEQTNLPDCFRRYLHEMYDRNNESVRKLMRCLAQHPEESCNEARRAQRFQPHYSGSQEEDFSSKHEPQRKLYERKVVRKRKYSEQQDSSTASVPEDGLKFDRQFIRSDSDYGGQVFEPVDVQDSQNDSNESGSSSGDVQQSDSGNDRRSDSEESERMVYNRSQNRERPLPYRRLPQKYNNQKQYQMPSEESDQECSCEESGETYEHR
ncbi:uncharacterized protein LOC128729110 [Anopheles nili]|uniref:uncharacterized protein LOC128729110 n=1 Tax=Anopheles nili TaxID=185578 RepID=UPI00237B0541|nr:uncharacterized protein LOC128729110 [Anopheles nili]